MKIFLIVAMCFGLVGCGLEEMQKKNADQYVGKVWTVVEVTKREKGAFLGSGDSVTEYLLESNNERILYTPCETRNEILRANDVVTFEIKLRENERSYNVCNVVATIRK